MTDRGPYGREPDPTEGGPIDLPPIGGDDPEPTRVFPGGDDPYSADPTAAMPPGGAGPYDPGPPFGGGGGGGGPGGPHDPDDEYEPEPEPWYRQRGAVAALATGLVALILIIIALFAFLGDDGDDTLVDTSLPSLPSSTTSTTIAPTLVPVPTVAVVTTAEPATTPPATVPPETIASTTTLPPPTTPTPTTTTTTSTTTTTTTIPETTTTEAPTTVPETTTTTLAPIPTAAPDDSSPWDLILASPSLTELRDAIQRADVVDAFDQANITVLAPDNTAFQKLRDSVGGEELLADPERLRELLARHVILETLDSNALFARDEVETSGGDVLTIDGEAQTIQGAHIFAPDRDTANGSILHAIDLVIV